MIRMKYCPQCARPLERRKIDASDASDEVERVACSAAGCTFVHWDNPIPVVAALVQTAAGFVLARNAKWPPGLFSIIAGFLEREESPEGAIAREAKEELGLETRALTFIGHYPFFEQNQLMLAFLVRADGVPVPNAELAEVKVLSRAELERFDFGRLELTARIVRDALRMP